MYFIGQWPFVHTITLRKMKQGDGIMRYYIVDTNTISDKVDPSLIRIDEYHVAWSKEMDSMITPYLSSNIPPPIPDVILPLIEDDYKIVDHLTYTIDDIRKNAPILITTDGDISSEMHEVGASYNSYFGMWYMNIEKLKKGISNLEKKKIQIDFDPRGGYILLSGDVKDKKVFIQSIGGVFDIQRKAYKIPISYHDIVKKEFNL